MEKDDVLRAGFKAVSDELARLVAARAPDPRALSREGMAKVPLVSIAINALHVRRQNLPRSDWHPAKQPAISIVLGTYRRLPLLKKAIDSIRKNGISAPYEIVVIDGGSRDGTAEWLIDQPDILTIVHHNREGGVRNRSWGWFMNVAFRATHGRCVLMISDDSLLVPGSVDAGLARVAELEAAGRRVGGVAFYFRNWPMEPNYFVQKTIGGMLMVNHGIFLREALEAVGYCEEEAFEFYKCDSDLCLKMWSAGYEIADCPNAFVEHLVLPEERARIENNKTMEQDRDVLLARWDGIYTHSIVRQVFNQPDAIKSSFVEFD